MLKFYLDTADLNLVKKFATHKEISGFTTNPTLIKKSGISDYISFVVEYLNHIGDHTLSVEVIADSESEMIKQAIKLYSLSEKIYVKIPVMFTNGKSTSNVIAALSKDVKLNVTAITNSTQVTYLNKFLPFPQPLILSYFAGRVADAGHDYLNIGKSLVNRFSDPNIKILWASTREIYNVVQAKNLNFDIITITPEIFSKYENFGKNLDLISVETIKMFHEDGLKSGFQI